VELDPQRDDARRLLVTGLLEIGRYEEALGQLDGLRRQDPDNPLLMVQVARCHSGLGRADQAAQLLDDLLAKQPHHGQALKLRGQVALAAGHPLEAERWLRDALRELPPDYQARWSLYQALQQQGKEAEAQVELAEAKRLEELLERFGELSNRKLPMAPHDPALHYQFAMLLREMGFTDLSVTWLLSALHEDPRYRPAHLALADYYDKQGNQERAAAHREWAQKLQTEGKEPKPAGSKQ
jgi:predicted Zn-dependent protease